MALNFSTSNPLDIINQTISENEGKSIDDAKELAIETKKLFSVEDQEDHLEYEQYYIEEDEEDDEQQQDEIVTTLDEDNDLNDNEDTQQDEHQQEETDNKNDLNISEPTDILSDVKNSSDFFDIKIKIINLFDKSKLASFSREMHKDDYDFNRIINGIKVPNQYQLLINQASVDEKSYFGYRNDQIFITIPAEHLEQTEDEQVFTRYIKPVFDGRSVGQVMEQSVVVKYIDGKLQQSEYQAFYDFDEIRGLKPKDQFVPSKEITSRDDDQITFEIEYDEVLELSYVDTAKKLIKYDSKGNKLLEDIVKVQEKRAKSLYTGRQYQFNHNDMTKYLSQHVDFTNEEIISTKDSGVILSIVVRSKNEDSTNNSSKKYNESKTQEQYHEPQEQSNIDLYTATKILENELEKIPSFTQKSKYAEYQNTIKDSSLNNVLEEFNQYYVNKINSIRSKLALRPLILESNISNVKEYQSKEKTPYLYELPAQALADRHLEKMISKVVDDDVIFDKDIDLLYDLVFNQSISYINIEIEALKIDTNLKVAQYKLTVQRK